MPNTEEGFVNLARLGELWAAVQTALAGKADASALQGYTTPEAVATAITTALSGYATDTGVQAAITTALANYITQAELNAALQAAIGDAVGINHKVVDALPETDIDPKTIYLVPAASAGEDNAKDEYMHIDGKWERIGSTTANVENCWTREELRPITAGELQAILV